MTVFMLKMMAFEGETATQPPAAATVEGDLDLDAETDTDTAAALGRLTAVLAELSPGYSGADIKLLCRDAAMAPMRRAITGKVADCTL